MDLLEQLIFQQPKFHVGETEIQRAFRPSESLASKTFARRLLAREITSYAIGEEVLRFLFETIGEQSQTVETGAGYSTLVFAMQRAKHIAITPSVDEIRRIEAYAKESGIGLETVEFVTEQSEHYLPSCHATGLDLVLIDGKHAFPWPVIDWFFTADKLKRGGLLLLDDVQIRSVAVLSQFLSADPGWETVHNFSGKTLVFRKTCDNVRDVAWHMQPWIMARPASLRGLGAHARSYIGRLLKRG